MTAFNNKSKTHTHTHTNNNNKKNPLTCHCFNFSCFLFLSVPRDAGRSWMQGETQRSAGGGECQKAEESIYSLVMFINYCFRCICKLIAIIYVLSQFSYLPAMVNQPSATHYRTDDMNHDIIPFADALVPHKHHSIHLVHYNCWIIVVEMIFINGDWVSIASSNGLPSNTRLINCTNATI